jgi:dolichol-phosphate mannosyltransferase
MNTPSGRNALIIVPTFNESENIIRLLDAIFESVPDVHVLVVDDNSPDGTGQLVEDYIDDQGASPQVHIVHRHAKEGLGPAYIAGFRWALERDYEVVFSMDADFSHNPRYLPTMLSSIAENDVVVGSRYVGDGGTENWHWLRRWLSRLGGIYARAVLGVPVSDMTAGFNAYRRSVLERMDFDRFELLGFGFQLEMKYRAHQLGSSFEEVPIVFPDRVRGESKMSGSIATEALFKVWQLRFSRSRDS